MSGPSLIDGLNEKFGEHVTGANLDGIDPWIEVSVEKLVEVLTYLRDDSQLKFDYLNSITCVDYLHTDAKKAAKADWEPHLEVVYHLWSVTHRHSLVVKVIMPRWKDDKPGQLPEVPTASEIWPAADWHEREAYDLFGIRFVGHPNMRRILCPEDWVGHPLRKDYEMPLEYHGIRGR